MKIDRQKTLGRMGLLDGAGMERCGLGAAQAYLHPQTGEVKAEKQPRPWWPVRMRAGLRPTQGTVVEHLERYVEAVKKLHLDGLRAERRASRSCGECSACCVVVPVEAEGKSSLEPCRHLRENGGCARYDDRHEECMAYYCSWLGGTLVGDDLRPDRAGFLVEGRQTEVGVVVVFREIIPGALNTDVARGLIAEMATENALVVVKAVNEDGSPAPDRLVGDRDAVLRFIDVQKGIR